VHELQSVQPGSLYRTNACNSNIYCTFDGFILTIINKEHTLMCYSNRSSMKTSTNFGKNRKKHYKTMSNIFQYYDTDLVWHMIHLQTWHWTLVTVINKWVEIWLNIWEVLISYLNPGGWVYWLRFSCEIPQSLQATVGAGGNPPGLCHKYFLPLPFQIIIY